MLCAVGLCFVHIAPRGAIYGITEIQLRYGEKRGLTIQGPYYDFHLQSHSVFAVADGLARLLVHLVHVTH